MKYINCKKAGIACVNKWMNTYLLIQVQTNSFEKQDFGMKWSVPYFETTSVGEKGHDSNTLHGIRPRGLCLQTSGLANPCANYVTLNFRNAARPKQRSDPRVLMLNPWFHCIWTLYSVRSLERRGEFSIWHRPWLLSTFLGARTTGPSLKCTGEDSQPEHLLPAPPFEMYLTVVHPLSRKNIYPPTCIKRTRN